MTRQELEQLRSLPKEIKQLQDELHDLPVVSDSVTGSRLGIPYDQHVIMIEGVDMVKAGQLRGRITRKLVDLRDRLGEMEDWLDGVEDSEMRTILRMRYRNGLTEAEIARELGYSRSAVAMKLNRFFPKSKL